MLFLLSKPVSSSYAGIKSSMKQKEASYLSNVLQKNPQTIFLSRKNRLPCQAEFQVSTEVKAFLEEAKEVSMQQILGLF